MRRRRRRRINPVIIVGLLIAAVAVIGIVTTLIMRRIPTKKQMDLTEYYGQTGESEAVIIIGTQILEEKAAMSGEQPYLPVDVVDSYLNQRYYWDEEGQQILYATPSELVSVPASSEAGGDVWLKDGTAYLSLDFVKRYTDLDTYVYQQPNRVAIQKDFSGISVVTANKDTYVRYRGGIKAEVLSKINKGDNLLFMEELENWVQVATWDGYIGYVEKKSVSDVQTVTTGLYICRGGLHLPDHGSACESGMASGYVHRCQCRTFRFYPEYDRGECDLTYLVLCVRQQRQYH